MILTTLTRPDVIPFPKPFENLFRKSRRANLRADLVLGWKGYVFIVVVPTLLTYLTSYFAGVSSLDAAIACAVLSVVISNGCSMYFTGTAPNSWSQESDRDQQACEGLRCLVYDNIALYMLDQARSREGRERMEQVARVISVDTIRQRLMKYTTQTLQVANTLRRFTYTIDFLATGHVCHDARFEFELSVRGLLPPRTS